ncbi:hypothetical protein [Flavobacterium sp.]|uniref:hypothetical protein n=1 Tax=Flavobacterium sp. TaxID=239 RepID=UPI0025CBA190|nr:hypothetical protein [Flavobacterium sp.]
MKNASKLLMLISLIGLISLNSCSNDSAGSSNKITANSTLKKLLSRVSQKRTSNDNVVDSTSCFTVQLPFTVIVNNTQVVVATQADYQAVANLFDEHEDDEDHLEFVFPITIIFSDFTQQVVTSNEQLHALTEQCESDDVDNDEDESNDDDDNAINCVSLTYPFVISTTHNSVLEDVTINNDHDLYVLLETVEGSNYVTINYPISIVDANGHTVVVQNNHQLEEDIVDATSECGNHDSDDENDNEDDGNHNDGD